ncbi:LacI family DNA-binding transcriptional regulator [Psychromarinibacter halotolerans]|uniref:LacI family DNA-binding transcriptional regulator n=1 Tax=Psychromarinibacter halotolerans TaxID=1775175 RepID=UPI0023D7E40F|nr:LacI family DNA-binding transcriptional regulator [Psychromarinibacter halotolerans]
MVLGRGGVSAKDVAKAAGVSRAAVSRAFTPGASISAETRKKVMKAADTLGYQVNHLARGLIRSETGIVALIAAELATPYRSALLAALSERLQEAGKVAMLINSDRSDDSVERALRQAISYRTDAAVVLSGMPKTELTETCLKNGMRLVLINRDEYREGSYLIRLDDRAAGRTAFATLAAAGCRRLALATSQAGTPSLSARRDGFRDAAAAAGVEIVEEATGPTSYETGLSIGTRLMSQTDRPDGVFCTTDLLALGVMDAARHRFGVRIPEDLSVIGFDDVPQASWESYDLTTFSQPVGEIADACVDWLTGDAMSGDPLQTSIPVQLAWRGSVRKNQPF